MKKRLEWKKTAAAALALACALTLFGCSSGTESPEGENVAFSQFVKVTTVPSTLTVAASGGNFLYSVATILVDRIGDLN